MSEHGDRLLETIVAAARRQPIFAAAPCTASIDLSGLSPIVASKLKAWTRQPNHTDQ